MGVHRGAVLPQRGDQQPREAACSGVPRPNRTSCGAARAQPQLPGPVQRRAGDGPGGKGARPAPARSRTSGPFGQLGQQRRGIDLEEGFRQQAGAGASGRRFRREAGSYASSGVRAPGSRQASPSMRMGPSPLVSHPVHQAQQGRGGVEHPSQGGGERRAQSAADHVQQEAGIGGGQAAVMAKQALQLGGGQAAGQQAQGRAQRVQDRGIPAGQGEGAEAAQAPETTPVGHQKLPAPDRAVGAVTGAVKLHPNDRSRSCSAITLERGRDDAARRSGGLRETSRPGCWNGTGGAGRRRPPPA